MITVACVLRSGGDFSREWVWALKRAVARHLPDGFDFVCLTDVPGLAMWAVPLEHSWPRWWSKLELFRPGLFTGPVLYMDLDTLPVGDLSDIASYTGEFAMISDFYRPKLLQSGVLAFTPGPVTWQLWERWVRDPAGHMKKFRGDGEWIAAHVGKADRLQDLYPGQIVSFKAHARKGPTPNARLVCGHGKPRFNTTSAGWAHNEWRRVALPEKVTAWNSSVFPTSN